MTQQLMVTNSCKVIPGVIILPKQNLGSDWAPPPITSASHGGRAAWHGGKRTRHGIRTPGLYNCATGSELCGFNEAYALFGYVFFS